MTGNSISKERSDFLVCFFTFLVFIFCTANFSAGLYADDVSLKLKEDSQLEFSHMDYRLSRLLLEYQEGGMARARTYAYNRKMDLSGDVLTVILEGKVPENYSVLNKSRLLGTAMAERATKTLKASLIHSGGSILRNYGNKILARIPLKSLRNLCSLPEAGCIRLPDKPHPCSVVSQGVNLIGADRIQKAPSYKGKGVKVCVLDLGFEKYTELLGTELPQSVTAKTFASKGGIQGDTFHGTACAEIVYDVAPDAELYLSNIYYSSDLYDAVQWIVEQKIDVISYSLGSYWGPGDGRGYRSELVKYAHENGVIWVTSAGNSADDHWSGTFRDTDGDMWHEFSSDGDEILEFYVTKSQGEDYGVDAVLKWDDWGTYDNYTGFSGSNNDYDLYLYVKDGENWVLVDKSANRQDGQYLYPYEEIDSHRIDRDEYWGIKIKKHHASKNVEFDLYIPTHTRGSMEYLVNSGSVTAPADSEYAIAVGATDGVGDYYHGYSSQGPTRDGRFKPDICAPSGVNTSNLTYGKTSENLGFYGTSASSPHVAGAIALLCNKTPFSLNDVLNIIYGRIIDKGDPGFDNIYGRGRLNLLTK